MIYYILSLLVTLVVLVILLYFLRHKESFTSETLDSCVNVIKGSKAYNNLSAEQKEKYKKVIELLKVNTRRYSGNTTRDNPLQMSNGCVIPRTYNCFKLGLRRNNDLRNNDSSDKYLWSYTDYCVIDSSILEDTNTNTTLSEVLEYLYKNEVLGQVSNISDMLIEGNLILTRNKRLLEDRYKSKLVKLVDLTSENIKAEADVIAKRTEYNKTLYMGN